MPGKYTSFQIRNTTRDPMILSLTDPDGQTRTVAKLQPGKRSTQVAPDGASWRVQSAEPRPEEGTPSRLPEAQTIVSRGESFATDEDSSSQEVEVPAVSEPIPYEAFLRIETGSHTARIKQLLATPDGKSLVTAGEDKTIRIWDIEGRRQASMLLGQIGEGEGGKIQSIAMSPDGKVLAVLVWVYPGGGNEAYDRETDVRVYELATGNLQARHRYAGTLCDIDFSPDRAGKYLVMAGNPKDVVRCGYVHVYESGAILDGFGEMPAPLQSGVLYDNDTLIPSYVRFVPQDPDQQDQYAIVAASWIHNKGEPDEPEYTGRIYWYAYSTQGLQQIQSSESAEFKRPATPQKDEVVSRIRPDSLAVSPEFVITTAENDGIRELFCYDHTGTLVAQVPSETEPANPAFSRDGSLLIVGQRKDDSAVVQVKVYAPSLGQFNLKSIYFGHDAAVNAVALLQDGTAVSAGGNQNSIHFWLPAHLEGEVTAVIRGTGRVARAVGINEQEQIGIGNHSDLRSEEGTILLQRMFDLRTLTLTPLAWKEAAAFQRSQQVLGEQRLEWRQEWGYVNLFLNDQPLTGVYPVGWYFPTTFGFTPSGTIITGDTEGKVRVASRRPEGYYEPPQRLLVGHTARILDHAASSKWLVTAGRDQILRLWFMEDVEQDVLTDLEPALSLFIGADDEWVIWSKSGYYMASQNGERYLGYHVNRGPDREAMYFSIDRFHSVFFRPDVIQAILFYGSEGRVFERLSESQVSIGAIQVEEILPPIIELNEGGVKTFESQSGDQGFVTFTLTVTTHGKPISRLCILRNGRLIYVLPNQDRSAPASGKVTIPPIPLLPGNNRFKIFAENQDAQSHTIRSNPIELTLIGKARYDDQDTIQNGMLYILAIGVSTGIHLKKRMPGDEKGYFELSYAHRDARAIFEAFTNENRAFEGMDKTLLMNEQATLQNIRAALDQIDQKINRKVEERITKREPARRDVLLVYLSGHGVFRLKNQQLYFWNYDFDMEAPGETGLAFMDLGERITSMQAEVVLMTDACHSGMAGSDVVKGFDPDQNGIDPNELAMRIYGINESDIYIFNAARRSESAREDGSIEHGYFTKAILDALNSAKPDVTMMGLIDQVQWRVQQYKVAQNPVCRVYGDLLPLKIYEK